MKNPDWLGELLESAYCKYNSPTFISDDPIAIPHMFSKLGDIEISGFFAAMLSWGRREQIVKASLELMRRFDFEPYDFVINASADELKRVTTFVHRTFNSIDCEVFILQLRYLLHRYKTLENAFTVDCQEKDTAQRISNFKQKFFVGNHVRRSEKHLPDPHRGSAAKRLNMFLRWMVRYDGRGVDFGIWKTVRPEDLICPLDLHSGNVARRLGLLERKPNDWKAAVELTQNLKQFDASDPVKYDFALFGLGWYEKFR